MMSPEFLQALRKAGPQPLGHLPIAAGLMACVLAPHPDDFDAIGVTLRYLSEKGVRIDVAVSRTGSGVEGSYRPGATLSDMARLRELEQRRSLEFFGLPAERLIFFDMDNDGDDQLLNCPANRERIGGFLTSRKPDLVFLPHSHNTNTGHQRMHAMLSGIAPGIGRPLAALLIRDPKTIAMRTDLFMPFSAAEAEWKAALLRFHDSQHQRNLNSRGRGFDDRILSVNRQIARELGLKEEYAEAFEIQLW